MITPLLLLKERILRVWELTTEPETRQVISSIRQQLDEIIEDQVAEETQRQEEFQVLLKMSRER